MLAWLRLLDKEVFTTQMINLLSDIDDFDENKPIQSLCSYIAKIH